VELPRARQNNQTQQEWKGNTDMKIMHTWKIHEGKLPEALNRFARMTPEDEQKALAPHIKQVARWHDLVRGRGVVIYECDDGKALAAYTLHWNDIMDVDSCTVLDDTETRMLAQSRAAGP
jgi:hypothetical protein